MFFVLVNILLVPSFTKAEDNDKCPFTITITNDGKFEVEPIKHGDVLDGKISIDFKNNDEEVKTVYNLTFEAKYNNGEKWLNLNPPQTPLQVNQSKQIDFTIVTQDLEIGTYTALINVTSEPACTFDPLEVQLRVLGKPTIKVNLPKSSLYLSSLYKKEQTSDYEEAKAYPSTLELTVYNSNPNCSKLSFSINTNQDWLECNPLINEPPNEYDETEETYTIKEGKSLKFIVSVHIAELENIEYPYADCKVEIKSNALDIPVTKIVEIKPTEIEIEMRIGRENYSKKYNPQDSEHASIKELSFEEPPLISGGKSYVLLTGLIKHLDGELTYHYYLKNMDCHEYQIAFEDKIITLWSKKLQWHSNFDYIICQKDKPVVFDLIEGGVMIVNKNTMVPVSFFCDALGVDLTWDGETKTITLLKNLYHKSHYLYKKNEG